jgi:hypothetical protein
VIQSALFFALGFLCAAFLALMVVPAVWRRAVALTRRRIEASMPLTLNELQAEKDALRAEHAMAVRRLEMSVKSLKGKVASQIIDINREREETRRLAQERDRRDEAIAGLEEKGTELDAALGRAEQEMHGLAEALTEARREIGERKAELDRSGLALSDANLESSNRQIELVARETEIARLMGDVGMLHDQRKQGEQKLRDLASDHKSIQEALKAERRRSAEFERRLERAMATVADREEALERRERELTRLREEKVKKGILDMAGQSGASDMAEGDIEPAADDAGREGTEPAYDRRHLEERLTALTRENRKLRAEMTARQGDAAAAGGDEAGDTTLRERIDSLAAEMVALTAALEGPDSPIDTLIGAGSEAVPEGENRPSLADRVRALRRAAPRSR